MLAKIKKITAVAISMLLLFITALNASASDNYKNWLQSDSKWGKKCLGSSNETMSQVGCAVTAVAILAVHSGSASENSFDPGKLCDFLSKNNGFDYYANLYWGAVSKLVPSFTYQKKAYLNSKSKSGITKELAEYINQGYYIVLSVNDDSHYVAIDTVKGGEVYMMDPAQNHTNKLFDYYSAERMPQVKLFKGKNTPAKATLTEESTTKYLTGHYKVTSALNVRANHNTDSNVLITIPENQTVVVTSVYNNQWGLTEYKGKSGWIFLKYTKYTENSYTYKTGKYKVTASDGLYLRSAIGSQSSSICLIPKNSVISISKVSANWGKATYNNKTGWVCMEYISYVESSPATTKPTSTVTTKVTTTSKATTKTTVKTTVATTTTTQIPLVKGDTNRDGKINKTDLITLNNYIAKPLNKSNDIKYVMDVNNDNIIDERDSVYLFRIISRGRN